MDILFVLNPKSGHGEDYKIEDIIKRLASEHHFTWEILRTTGTADKKRIEDRIKELQPEKVVAIGGDGTINLVASQLVNKNIMFGLIPSGSANGLAYNLNISDDPEKALMNIIGGKTRPIDVIRINDTHICLHLADVGVNARLVKRFEKEGSKGFAGYGKQLGKEIFSKKRIFRFELNSPGIQEKMKAEMLVLANARSFGTGAQINPQGDMDDGKFEIVIIKPYPWWYMITFAFSFFTGRLDRLKHVKVFSTDRAQIEFKKPMDVQVDGELLEDITQLKITIYPCAIQVYYPVNT